MNINASVIRQKLNSQKGFGLVEVIIAIAIMGILAAGFLGALGTASKVGFLTKEKETAKNLLESQVENVAQQPFNSTGAYTVTVPPDYTGYSIQNPPAVVTLSSVNDSVQLQEITIVVTHNGRQFSLVDYKTGR